MRVFTVRRALSSPATLYPSVTSGGRLVARVASRRVELRIAATWEDHARVEASCAPADIKASDGDLHLMAPATEENEVVIAVVVPQRFSIDAHSEGPIVVTGKVEGNVDLKGPSITVDTVRGERLRLEATESSIEVRRLAEGTDVALTAKKTMDIAKLSATAAALTIGAEARLTAVYCPSLTVTVAEGLASDGTNKDAVVINNLHGHADVRVTGRGGAAVRRITGSTAVSCADGDVDVSFDALSGSSVLQTANGNVRVALATDIEVGDVDMAGATLSLDGATFVAAPTRSVGVVDGCAAHALAAVKARFEPNRKNMGRQGKIDITAAKAQRWSSAVSTADDDPTQTTKTRLQARAPNGDVSIRSLGWIDAIKLKYFPEVEAGQA